MQEAIASGGAYVTAHAVTRYLQRVEGVDLDVDERFFGATFVMLLHLFAAGLTRDEVTDRILKRPILDAMESGSKAKVRYGRFVATVVGHTVITVVDYRPDRQERPFKVPTRRESRRQFRQIGTRRKRAPV